MNWQVRLKLHGISLLVILVVFLVMKALDEARAEKPHRRKTSISDDYDDCNGKVKDD